MIVRPLTLISRSCDSYPVVNSSLEGTTRLVGVGEALIG